MARANPRRSGTRNLPRSLRPIVGGIALVGSVRLIDAVWRRTTGRPTPVGASADDTAPPGTAEEARLVRDRVAYALLLSAAMRLARRLGLPPDDAKPDDALTDDDGDAGR